MSVFKQNSAESPLCRRAPSIRGGSCCTLTIGVAGLLMVAVWLCTPSNGSAGMSVDALLAGSPQSTAIPVVVRFRRPDNPPASFRNEQRGDWFAEILGRKSRAVARRTKWNKRLSNAGAGRVRDLWMIEAVAMTAPAGLVEELRSDPEVESIRLDEVLVLVPAPSEAQIESAPNWNIQMLRAPELWDLGLRGQGVVVATLDSGVDPNHSDLKHKWRGGGNSWLDPHGEHAEPHDRSGHGTQAMGIIVGGDAGGQAIGIAPGAQWIAAKIFSDGGLSSFSVIHEAFQWVLDPDGDPLTDDAPAVVVCPWGIAGSLNQCNPEFNDDVQVLRAAGIAVVFPSGNDGPGFRTSSAPANTPGSLAVGAVDRWMNLAPFSSRGPSPCGGEFYPQLTAPGVGIRTSDLTAGGLFPEATATVSGTSFAAPHVGGALALLKSAFPAVPIEQIESSLLRSGLDGGTPGPDHGFGFGVVDVLAAHGELLAGLACTDSDGDGFYAEPGCGSPLDCNDSDPAVHPGAVDLARDGIDQDCSGFDLSIVVRRAVCSSRSGILQIVASSELKGDAQLSVEGFGAMEYRRGKNWSGRFREVQTCPTTVVVTGHEGSLAASVRVRPRR